MCESVGSNCCRSADIVTAGIKNRKSLRTKVAPESHSDNDDDDAENITILTSKSWKNHNLMTNGLQVVKFMAKLSETLHVYLSTSQQLTLTENVKYLRQHIRSHLQLM